MLIAYCAFLGIALGVPSQPGPRSNAEARALIQSSYKNARKNPERAITDLELFLDRYPKHSGRDDAEERLGDLYLKKEQPGDAERHYAAILLGKTTEATETRLKVKLAKTQIAASKFAPAKATLLPLLKSTRKRDALILLAYIEASQDLPIEGKAYLDAAEIIPGEVTLDLLRARVVVDTKRCALNERFQTVGLCLEQTAPELPLGQAIISDWCTRARKIYANALSKAKNFDSADRKYELGMFNKRLDHFKCPQS